MSPRPRQATGRPGIPVIPADWEAAHRVVMGGTLRAQVQLRHPGTRSEWSDTSEQMEQVPHEPYATVPARIQSLTGEARVVITAQDVEVVADYLVVIPVTAGPQIGDLVEVADAADDATLEAMAGLVLQVVHAPIGSELWERDLYCTTTT